MIPYHRLPLALSLTLVMVSATAQPKQPPTLLTSAFSNRFPDASKVEWTEKTDNFTVYLNQHDRKCEAKFTKSGNWISTEEPVEWDSLPLPVREAFKSGSYTAWNKNTAYTVRSNDGTSQFHLVLSAPDGGRKLLFYSSDGKLIKEH